MFPVLRELRSLVAYQIGRMGRSILMILILSNFSVAYKIPRNPESKWDTEISANLQKRQTLQSSEPVIKGEVRVAVTIKEIRKLAKTMPGGGKAISYVTSAPEIFTLRARLSEREEFYVGAWHISFEPSKRIKNIKDSYSCHLQFSHLSGEYLEVEQAVGDLILSGQLVGQSGLFAIKGTASKRVLNTEGQPVFDLAAGSNGTEEEIKKEILATLNNQIKK